MINIAVCIDNRFVMQAGVFMTSVCISNINNDITFYVVSSSLSDDDKSKLSDAVVKYNKNINFASLDLNKIKDFPVRKGDHISLATYYRILLPVILPESVDKVLYADCDMLVVDDLKDFYDTDLSDYSTAMTADMFYDDEKITSRLLYDVNYHYFNAGMLLINLKWWRKNDIAKKTITFVMEHKELCLAHDQDALNAVLHGTILRAPSRYNIQLDFLRKNPSNMIIKDNDVLKESLDSPHRPCIIHFTGPSKPWKNQCFNPYEILWDFFQSKTEWKNISKNDEFSGYKLLKWNIKQILEKLNIIHKQKNEYYSFDTQIKKIIKDFK